MPTHARTPPRGTRIIKISFVAPIFASSEISKTINMLSKYGAANVITRKKCNGTNIEQNGHLKYPILEIG